MPKVKTVKKSTPTRKTKTLKSSKLSNGAQINNQVSSTIPTQKPSMSVQKLIKTLKTKYSAAKNKTYAAKIKQYMRNQYEFIGIKAPERRAINKEIFEAHPVLNHPDIYQLFYLLWQEEERDYQCFVLDYCDKYIKHINHPDWNDQNLEVLKHLITNKSWWDTVDLLASKVVGILVLSDREKYSQLMDEWISDDNMWIRRTAILHQLNYKHKTDTDRLFRYSLQCAHEKEFFIQKSIGWALRNHFRTDPDLIKTFVSKNKSKLATLSVREALKHA
ncbi:uncharacterized protein LOC130010424 [Patella vulgata]|uniref:uncharacterized protein LOC130010424 n=1 Tax=Patella vulgata TaxID=6465 RepID=UPI00217FE672|nr:uncharacterized protein LOC130010424 [Patella vulgata]XP_055956794.1 uncharacterized protein LOC130010424 [Patella vulgata]